jgi:hypothetical protein
MQHREKRRKLSFFSNLCEWVRCDDDENNGETTAGQFRKVGNCADNATA